MIIFIAIVAGLAVAAVWFFWPWLAYKKPQPKPASIEDLERADIRWKMANDPGWREIFGNDYCADGTPKSENDRIMAEAIANGQPGGFLHVEGVGEFVQAAGGHYVEVDSYTPGYEEGNVFTPTKGDHLYLPGGYIVRRGPSAAAYENMGYSKVEAHRMVAGNENRDNGLCRCGGSRGHNRVREACFPKGY